MPNKMSAQFMLGITTLSTNLRQSRKVNKLIIMKQEIELKFHIESDDIKKLYELELLKPFLQTHKKQLLVSTYFDTPDLDLTKDKMALRVREIDGQYWQTIKAVGQTENGLSTRSEWEYKLSSNKPTLAFLPADLQNQLQPYEKNWKPIFITDFTRDSWQIVLSKAQHIELALDVGSIKVNDKHQESLCEVEVEIIEGDLNHLMQFAELLKQHLNLKPLDQSKAARGYALLNHAV